MSNDYVADTMAVILRLEKRKLSQQVKTIFEAIEKGKINLMIPAIVLGEIGYLSERNKIDTNLHEVKDYCQKFPAVTVEPITAEFIYRSFEIDDIPELHDRIIAGTASLKNLELITNDPMIIKSKYLSTIW
jgi:PIN domain nuclease of toxin-antitoxin system